MAKFIYRGDETYVGDGYELFPGEVMYAGHPAVKAGLADVYPYEDAAVIETPVITETEVDDDGDDVQFSAEYDTGL